MANLEFCDKHNMVAYLQKSEGSEGFHQIVDFLTVSHIRYALTESSTIHVSLIEQFWQIATASILENGDMEITATIDGKVKTVSETSIRRHLKLEESEGISDLPTTEIFEQLALMGSKKTAWEQFSSNIATVIICLATNRTFNFSKLIFDGTVKKLETSKGYTGVDTPLFLTMLVQGQILQGEGSTIPETEIPQPSSSTQTHVPDEAASTRQGSGNIHKTSTMPHDSPLPRVHTFRSDEGRMQQNELMDLVTKLTNRVEVLENDLKQTKRVYGAAFTKLIKKVKTLEKIVKLSKARRRANFVVSDDEEEDSFNQGRKIVEIDEDP
ncbi:hypothetical protein Tco_0544782 [Tanacetum coccineum]